MSGLAKNARKTIERRRLAAALRENLKRRKAQAKARASHAAAVPAHDSAGFADDKKNG